MLKHIVPVAVIANEVLPESGVNEHLDVVDGVQIQQLRGQRVIKNVQQSLVQNLFHVSQ